jgi:hypothetical protein
LPAVAPRWLGCGLQGNASRRAYGSTPPARRLPILRHLLDDGGDAAGGTCGKMGPLSFAPYGSGNFGRRAFKNRGLKPPPLPSPQHKCLEVQRVILMGAWSPRFGRRPSGANRFRFRSAAMRNRPACFNASIRSGPLGILRAAMRASLASASQSSKSVCEVFGRITSSNSLGWEQRGCLRACEQRGPKYTQGVKKVPVPCS